MTILDVRERWEDLLPAKRETFNPQHLILTETPAEWPAVPRTLLQKLASRSLGVFTPLETEIVKQIWSSRTYLVRNEYRAKCDNCGQIHDYYTWQCVPQVFDGYRALLILLDKEVDGGRDLIGYNAGQIVPVSPEEAAKLRALIQYRERRGTVARRR